VEAPAQAVLLISLELMDLMETDVALTAMIANQEITSVLQYVP